MSAAPSSRLRQTIEAAADAYGCPLKDFTVLADQNDPFRVDTPAHHRDGAWLAHAVEELGLGTRVLHLRGMHYMVLGWPKPNGTPYSNTEADWLWLSGDCGKAARWLGYIDFEQISDQRNSPPIIHEHTIPDPDYWVDAEMRLELPDLSRALVPAVEALDFEGRQPYRLVIFGEKSSLEDVLLPLARRYKADLYLPTGEISDTLMHRMARNGAEDGRPMVVFTFTDADPAGWQMPISIGRKLQALQASLFPDLDFEVRRVSLTPEQVGTYGLPSTPLKVTEKRADKWRQETGIEQIEVDALASLRPDLLREIAESAIEPFYDLTLDRRVDEARRTWERSAQEVIDNAVSDLDLDAIETDLAERFEVLNARVREVNDQLSEAVRGLELPPIVVPGPVTGDAYGTPLVDSRWSFAEQCAALRASKSYRDLVR